MSFLHFFGDIFYLLKWMSKEERERDYLPHLSDNQDMLSWLFHGLWASEERFFRAFWSKDILQSSAVSAEDIQWLRWSLPDLCAGLYLQFFLFKVACPLTYFWICIFWSSQGFFLTVHCDWLPATCFLPTPSSIFFPAQKSKTDDTRCVTIHFTLRPDPITICSRTCHFHMALLLCRAKDV